MTNVYRHKPLSAILAPQTGSEDTAEAPTAKPAAADAPDTSIPEKYRGKSVQDIIEMHRNSESRLGQLQNEVGQLRGLVSDLASVQRAPAPQVEEPKVDLTGDELISNPAEAIRRVVQAELAPVRKEAETSRVASELDRETQRLYAEFEVDKIATSPEFGAFANRTPSRQRDLELAVNGKGLEQVRAARRLLEDYTDFTSMQAPKDEEPAKPKTKSNVERAREVSNEANGGAGKPLGEQIYESDVIELAMKDPAKYRSPSFQSKLTAAIREGRFVKNG